MHRVLPWLRLEPPPHLCLVRLSFHRRSAATL
jgi:hypothetical protein